MDFPVLLPLRSHSPALPVLPPWATSNQPVKSSSLKKDLLCQENEEGEKRRIGCVCPQKQSIEGMVTMWGTLLRSAKGHVAGTRLLHQAGQLMKVN